MEALIEKQSQLGKEICQLLTNTKKDSKERKTAQYLIKRQKTLDQLWSEFLNQHLQIEKLNMPDNEYTKQEFFRQVEERKLELEALLEKYTTEIQVTVPSETNTHCHESPTICKRLQFRMQSLTDQINSIDISKDLHLAVIEFHNKNLDEAWKCVESLYEEVVISGNDTPDISKAVKELQCRTKNALMYLHTKKSSSTPSESEVRLPNLTIPIFDGKYESWTAFHDIYVRLIHNNQKLANIEKMQYLKTHLRGEALRLLNHLELSDANYSTAWEAVTDRFNNKRKLVSSHIQTILSLPKIDTESTHGVKKILDTVRECIHAITNLGVDTSSWAPIIIQIALQKVDSETHRLYEQSLQRPRDIPTFDIFFQFMDSRFQSLEAIMDNKRRDLKPAPKQKPFRAYHSIASIQCKFCQKSHSIYNCSEFQKLDTTQRINFVLKKGLCENCINHDAKDKCKSSHRCSICKQKHHTLIHEEQKTTVKNQRIQSNFSKRTTAASNTEKSDKVVILATALVKVEGISGKTETLRALIDPGSQSSFLTENAAQLLSLPRHKTSAKIAGVGGVDAGIAHYKMPLNITPRFPSTFQLSINPLILKNLTKLLPDCKLTIPKTNKNRILADPWYNKPGPIDLILGADAYPGILLSGVYKHKEGLIEQETELGWIVTGPTNQQSSKNVYSLIVQTGIDDTLRKFWELEELPTEVATNVEDDCEKHYLETHVRNTDGTYTVRIPFKENRKPLGESRKQAVARLLQMEKKFLTDEALAREYKKFMREYLTLGHMKPISAHKTDEEVYYMPHQAVIKTDSSTTKLRVVFDASSITSNNISLNQNMLIGPRLQPDLSTILLRWRKHKYVFSADVEKMYRQIRIDKRDQKYQKIVWRFSPDEPIREYELTTVTYGTASAPYLAIKTMQQLAEDEKYKYPTGSKTALEDFYVDDMMSGASTLQQAKIIQREIIQLMASGGFSLRKWTSNHPELLESIPEDKREKGNLQVTDDDTVKTLGISWSPKMDQFKIKINMLPTDVKLTKRMLLSEIAKIFDPLGWVAPVTITAKKMLQELWIAGIKLDESLPTNLSEKWSKFREELPILQQITIPRWIHTESNNDKIELHGFCDASETAYAAVLYTKVTTTDGKIITRLLTAKSKVAPIKSKTTIPRLELCGAVLLAKLLVRTVDSLAIQPSLVKLWTDSQIALAWIKGDPCRWETFVRNRVTEIQKLTNPNQWAYIKTAANPADCASRGINPNQLRNHPLWWSGPDCIRQSTPESQPTLALIDVPEKKMEQITAMATAVDTSIIERFSNLHRLARVLSYCNRFINKCKKSSKRYKSITLTTEEINSTMNQVLRMTQSTEFNEEILRLKQKKQLPNKSKLRQLSPFLDNAGILRVGGRLQQSFLTFDEKHPIILPKKSHLGTLIIRDGHLKTLHGGNQATLAQVRRKYWIIDGRSIVRQYIHQCVKCVRFKAQPTEQQMGSLPAPRVCPSRPFTHTGVDYAGPVKIRTSKTRGLSSYKGYIAVFVCMATKAVHIEAVSDLTAESFIAAFKRFTARRGLCSHVYSDCGTNFIGAQRIMDEDLQKAIKMAEQHVAKLFNTDGVQWHFNPPAAPHFGGLWESAVKSIKHHMKRVIGEVSLTFEELSTVLYQIEASLNSRPLCQFTSDPHDINVLTPGHFLLGSAPISPPQPYCQDEKVSPLKRWRLVEKIARDIWKSWSSEYLSQLQQRKKWLNPQQDIKPGELVIIKEENLPPAKWLLGRITKTFPGPDNRVRVIELRCKGNALLTRPITKICRLPIENEEIDEIQTTVANISSHHINKNTPNCVAKRTYEKTKTKNKQYHERSKKRRINPVTGYSNLISIEKQREAAQNVNKKRNISDKEIRSMQCPPPKRRLTVTQYQARKRDQVSTFFLCLILLFFVKLGKAEYNITHPSPGLFIEHIGEVQVQRGTLRIELTYPLNTAGDIECINNTINQMDEICEKAKWRSPDIHCEMLLHHLKEKQYTLLRDIENIKAPIQTKRKRNVFGSIFHYMFGMDDEVYSDIDALKQNQLSLLQATQHQTTLMLTTTAQIKDLEAMTQKKLTSFTEKLNQAIAEINKVEGWFKTIDINRINIHLLAAYNIAAGMLEELETRYNLLLKVILKKADLLECLTPSELLLLIQKASRQMPPNINILPKPEHRIESIRNETHIIAQGFLHLATSNTFNLLKVTPIPRRLSNNSYVIPSIIQPIIAIDYNSQTYFELSEAELDQCAQENKYRFLCSPAVISKIDTNPNCVVDEIYHRPEKIECVYTSIKISQTVFKHLNKLNTWLFVANQPTTAAVICNGLHEDVELRDIGIIEIKHGCVIKTKRNTITSEMTDTIPVKGTYNHPLNFNLSQLNLSKQVLSSSLTQESILKPSDRFTAVYQNEKQLQDDLARNKWKTVGHHVASGSLTFVITILILLAVYKYREKRKYQVKRAAVQPQHETQKEDIELNSTNYQQQQKKFDLSQYDVQTSI